jgi:hypothetical protein
VGAIEITAQACVLRARCLFELGDIAGVEREVERCAYYATVLRRPSRQYVVAFWRTVLAWFAGRFDEAQGHAAAALEIGQRAKEPIGRQIYIGRAAALQAEMEAIAEHLEAAVGLHGRDRPAGSPTERARLIVTKRIKYALKKIADVDPALGIRRRALAALRLHRAR